MASQPSGEGRPASGIRHQPSLVDRGFALHPHSRSKFAQPCRFHCPGGSLHWQVRHEAAQVRRPHPEAELSGNGRRLALTGPVTFTLVRPTAGTGILGEWRAEDGNPMPMTFGTDGSFQMGNVKGKWHAAGGTQVFILIWPGNRFSTVVHPDRQSFTMSDPAYGWTKDLKRVSCGPGPGR